jgi:hypothetical protein
MVHAEAGGASYIDIRSEDVHRNLGGYPGPSHRMPSCCRVMLRLKTATDRVLESPPKGKGASLVIRYSLPR